ncbi:hypothetical protein EX30DRAFT_362019 [Ascodesmis nigricans]|uniref:Pre-rRNA-processing protein RIX1 n=1 Tax=Ascodesmis nigricans TaxID=341454 RepID=A0A4S2N4K3_9PEZI|nr:hypothetical protein EX30DRAFT_362019 [Ascodesmis nigricans]
MPDPLLSLRRITAVLTATPEPQLPQHATTLATLILSAPILDSASAIAANPAPRRQQAEEAAVLLNKFKTRVSALLQSRNAQARWTGLVLAKCAVESSFEALASWAGTWVRLMMGLITRPESATIHSMLIRSLARIFTVLTTKKPNLTREIVTPNIPAAVTGFLGLLKTYQDDALMTATVLEAVRDILVAHPITFRPHVQKTRTAVVEILHTQDSEADVEKLCRQIYVCLHLCTSASNKRNNADGATNGSGNAGGKANAVATEWSAMFLDIVKLCHDSLDQTFAPVQEDFDYRNSTRHIQPADENLKGLSPSLYLRILRTFMSTPTTAQPAIPLPYFFDLTSRILSITSSSSSNPAVETTVRESLFSELPPLHADTFDLLTTVSRRLEKRLLPFIPTLLDQVTYIFLEERTHSNRLRASTFTLLSTLITISGPAFQKPTVDALNPIFSGACDELIPPPAPTPKPAQGAPKQKASEKKQTTHADNLLNTSSTIAKPYASIATRAASTLITRTFQHIQPDHLRAELRSKMERTAVLTGNHEALLAAVLFPRSNARATVLPHFVATAGAAKSEVASMMKEAVVRPRLPVVWTGLSRAERKAQEEAGYVEVEGDEEDEEDEEEDDHTEQKSTEDVEMQDADAEIDSDRERKRQKITTASSTVKQTTDEVEYPALYPPLPTQPTAPAPSTLPQRPSSSSTRESTPSTSVTSKTPKTERVLRSRHSTPGKHSVGPGKSVSPVVGVNPVVEIPITYNGKRVAGEKKSKETERKEKERHEKEKVVEKQEDVVMWDGDDDDELPEIVLGDSSDEE